MIEIDIHEISPNKDQPRKTFDEQTIANLAKSIEQHGMIQPIVVRKKEYYYEIIAGERRWRAAKSIGLRKIPAIVKETSDLEVAQLALIENIQREDLNSIDEAYAFRSLMDKHNLTQEEISEILGKSRSYIANVTRLLNLEEEVKGLIVENKLTSGHGRTILGLNNNKEQIVLAEMIIEKKLSVRDTERLVKKINKSDGKNLKERKQTENNTIFKDIEDKLRDNLGTKVQIRSGKNKGKIEIEYYNDQELERIINLINK